MITEGYFKIAAAILESQISAYNYLLKLYARYEEDNVYKRMKHIENEMLTDYYAKLSLYQVDFLEYINERRRKFGLPERTRND